MAAQRIKADPPDARSRATRPQAAAASGSALLMLFLISLLIPARFNIAGLLLTPDRLFLLLAFIPLALRLVSGKAGKIHPTDILIFLYCVWIGIALFVVHGTSHIAFIGITTIELFGGYLVGRTLVRSQMDYRAFFRYFAYGLLFLLPFVIVEQMTRRLIISEIVGSVFNTPNYVNYDQRLGLNRVQAVFEHPILFGVFCSIGISNFYFLNRTNLRKALPLAGLATFMTFMSVSSSAVTTIFIQIMLILWEKFAKARWKLLVLISISFYIIIDLLSNRTPLQVFISYATLNSATAGYRFFTWEYGTASVANHPVFGIGLNDWERIWWMYSPSVDNFWLLTTMRYGLPAIVLLMAGIVLSFWGIFNRRDMSIDENECRNAYCIAAVTLFFTLCTVHVWGPTSVLFMFYIGAGIWLLETGRAASEAGSEAPSRSISRRGSPERRPGGQHKGPRPEAAAASSRRGQIHRRSARPGPRGQVD